eukprot:TRINITY_DN120679_c0_g1_i1.p2 TRINITY_DN120679_c0_g1~~TRINITY_DN120679_c0_g1_i1.p2  ORF type:complete len:476 (-),score=147.38 TRINITY_DN120679_c0_g1_i1:141-1568(-)
MGWQGGAVALLAAGPIAANGISLRAPGHITTAALQAASQKPVKHAPRKCTDGSRSGSQHYLALLANGTNTTNLGQGGGVYMDGFSRVGCEVDVAPADQRIYFSEHACGAVKSCRLTELPMEPRLCFDFCRQYEDAKFFGLKGSKCYCSRYFHAKSTGGQGTCDFHCEGDQKEMCGGADKSSLFEMHMCGNSGSEADVAVEMMLEASDKCTSVVEAGNSTAFALNGLATSWDLGVCSMAPEGPRVCALNQALTAAANKLTEGTARTSHAEYVLQQKSSALSNATEAVKAAGDALTAAQASAQELATQEVRDAAAKATGSADSSQLALTTLAGPLTAEKSLENFAEVFKPLGDTNASWYAVCGLEAIKGQFFAAMTEDDPTICGNHCLTLSTGVDHCVGFNYQYREGLAVCQFLQSEGIFEPDDSLSKAIPIFEVSQTKRDAMGISSMGCYVHGAFTAGHKSGPLGTKVLKEVSAGL